jgi:ubiquinone/menaquinone biosynthesis C-methylase UbiE
VADPANDDKLHAFDDVDRSAVAPELIDYLEQVAAVPAVRAVHDATEALLALRPGERVLEVGCGLGTDARAMARAVAPGGSVVAVDVSELMLEAARARHEPGLDVTYEIADVTDLPYDDASFDVVRIERVLQHVADLDRACAEMARVLRPGGRLLALDTDWGSLVVDITDTGLAERCLAQSRSRMIQPRAALALRRLLVAAGLRDVSMTPFAFCFTSLAEVSVLLPMLNPRVPREARMLPDEDRDRWFAAVNAADAEGTFLAGWTGYAALARKP